MVAISFTVFKDKILSGVKDQTIRKWSETRVNQMKKSEKLQLYWKQRTPECELLKEVILDEVFKIKFAPFEALYVWTEDLGWILITSADTKWIVQRDGFSNYREFEDWFGKRYDLVKDRFSVIRWRDEK